MCSVTAGVFARVSGTLGFGAASVIDSAATDFGKEAEGVGTVWEEEEEEEEGAAPARGRALALGMNLFLDLSTRSQDKTKGGTYGTEVNGKTRIALGRRGNGRTY